MIQTNSATNAVLRLRNDNSGQDGNISVSSKGVHFNAEQHGNALFLRRLVLCQAKKLG